MQDGLARGCSVRPISRPNECRPFIVNFAMADGQDQDSKISKREFKKACKKGLVKFPRV